MSTERMSRRVLRIRPWLAVVVVAANALFLGGAASSYAESGWTPTTIGFGLLSALGVIGILELVVSRIVLHGHSLETRDLLSKRRYAASEIRGVKWEVGLTRSRRRFAYAA
jgi:hypothetical protein